MRAGDDLDFADFPFSAAKVGICGANFCDRKMPGRKGTCALICLDDHFA